MTWAEGFAALFFGVMGYLIVFGFLHMRAGKARPAATERNDAPAGDGDSLAPDEPDGGRESQLQEKMRAEGESSPSWWRILGVSETATVDQIRQAYRLQVSKYHADEMEQLATEFRAIAENRVREINGAYAHAIRIRAGAQPTP